MDNLVKMLLQEHENLVYDVDVEKLNNKKIIITGASGMIGVNLIASLVYLKLYRNFNIHVLAIVHSSPENWFLGLLELGNFGYIKCELTDVTIGNRLFDADIIIHAATYSQPSKFLDNDLETIQLNTSVTMNLMKSLKKNGKFLYLSTSEVYSGLDKETYTENDIGTTTPLHGRACYIESKRCGETICNAYYKKDVDVKIARICLVYGIGIKKNDTRALNAFIQNGLKDNYIELMDNGDAIRNYLYISDAVYMLWSILLHGKELIYNIGGDNETTIRDLAETIGKKLDLSPVIVPSSNTNIDAPKSVKLDMSKFHEEFGYDNQYVSLDNGIDKVIEWCQYL